MADFEESVKKLDFRAIVFTSIITALAFVVGLFWRDAISDTINTFVPSGEGLFYKYLAAVIATVVVIIFAYILIRAQEIKIKKIIEEADARRKRKVKKILSYKM
jgi:uncharacterized membrane protein